MQNLYFWTSVDLNVLYSRLSTVIFTWIILKLKMNTVN